MSEVQDYGRREGCRRVGVRLAVDQQEQCRDSVEASGLTRKPVGPVERG